MEYAAIVASAVSLYQQLQQAGVIEIVLGILDKSALAGLAAFAIIMLDRTYKDRIAAAEKYASSLEKIQNRSATALENNTAAMTRLTERLREFEDM